MSQVKCCYLAFYSQRFSVIFVSAQGDRGIFDRYVVIGPPSRVAFDSSQASGFQTPALGEVTDETIRDTIRLG